MKHNALVAVVANIGRRIVNFAQRIWSDHQELLETNPVYRHRLEAGCVALLGPCSLHPTAALVATVVLSIYVAAHETGSTGWRPGYGGPTIRRPDDPDWAY